MIISRMLAHHMLNRCQEIMGAVEAAEEEPNAAVRALHLEKAKERIQNLAQYLRDSVRDPKERKP